jgi:hypothetical protein
MKKILMMFVLSSFTAFAHAQFCPPAPDGYTFRVGAWGDHHSEYDDVRCYYYKGSQQIRLNAGVWLDESAFKNHPQWGHISQDHYLLCSGSVTDVRDCPFN